ncbi:MAG: hypothetical protein ACRD25_03300 [Terracidiphilus sp.]
MTLSMLAMAATLPVAAQYAGKVPEQSKTNGPDLRAVAVLEWTGDPGHPKASRLVPITLWDGQDLQDASIYMAQPEPLALQSEVEYKLKENGKTIGYYEVSRAGQSQGVWIGFGTWKPLTQPKPAEAAKQVADIGGDEGGRPVLHRAHNADGSSGKSSAPKPPPDPDRPTLKEPSKKASSAANPQNDVAYSQPIADVPDPDRPRLFHGKASDSGSPVLPTLAGLPPDMHQTIAVSDVGSHPDHIWTYSWASPDEEAKMRSDLEDMARKALAPSPPAAPPQAERHHATSHRRTRAAAPPPPLPLEDEQFHTFQLTYGGPATMVFSAHTQGSGAQEKFVTLIGQPDLYGNGKVLFKHLTSADDLDNNPAMRLIDPVDAMADNRGELLFELRGATQREFALYRVVNGRVEKLFTTLPESVALPAAPPAS